MTSDIQLAKNAGCKGVLVSSGKGGKDGLYDVDPDIVVDGLLEAAREILS